MKKNDYQSPEELAMQEALDRIREEYPDFWKDMDGLSEDTTKPDSEKRQRRKFRRRLIAACFICVCLLSTALTIFVNSDTAHAVKFAMEKKYYQAKGWVQATDPGSVESENVISVVITEEEKIFEFKNFWNKLVLVEYVPDDYCFKELYVTKCISGAVSATYQYDNHGKIIAILLRNNIDSKNTQLWIKTNDLLEGKFQYKVWGDESVGINGIDVIVNDIIISLSGPIDIIELKKIINGLKW